MTLYVNGKRIPERRDDNVEDRFGSGNDVYLSWETSDADAHYLNLAVLGPSRNIIISEDRNIDWTHATSTNPTLWIQSSDSTDVNDYLNFAHNQTNAVVDWGNGALSLAGGNVYVSGDDTQLAIGGAQDAILIWETADANANMLHLVLPTGDATNVPVIAIGDFSMSGDDLGSGGIDFSGVTSPTLALISADETDYLRFYHDATSANLDTDDGPFSFGLSGTFAVDIAVTAGGETFFNKNGIDIDFAIGSDNLTRAFAIDGGLDTIGIGIGGQAGQFLTIQELVRSSGTPKGFTFTGAAHTGLTAATEVIGVDWDLDATKTWAAGAGPLATQREFVFRAPTYDGNAAGALTITDATTVYISGAPIDAGANIILTNAWGLWIDDGNIRLDGLLEFGAAPSGGSASTRYQIYRSSTPSLTYQTPTGVNHQFFGAAVNLLEMNEAEGSVFNEGGEAAVDFRVESDAESNMFFIDAGANVVNVQVTDAASTTEPLVVRTTAAGSVGIGLYQTTTQRSYWNYTNATTTTLIDSDGTLSLGSNNTVSYSISQIGNHTFTNYTNASSAALTAYTFTGGAHTAITAATEKLGVDFDFDATKTWAAGAGPLAQQREIIIRAPTYVGDAGGALTITDAATMYLDSAPIQGANMTLTRSHALQIANDAAFTLGTTGQARLVWETADANANMLHLVLPTGDATNVPIIAIGNTSLFGVDLGVGGYPFQGTTAPTLVVLDSSEVGFIGISHDTTQAEFTTNEGPFAFRFLGSTAPIVKIQSEVATESPKLSFNQTTTEKAYIQYQDTGDIFLIDSDGGINLSTANSIQLRLVSTGTSLWAPTATTSGVVSTWEFRSAADTGITAATEKNEMEWDFSSTKTWADGAGPLALQREINIQAPTYAGGAGGALTISDAATVYINAGPIVGANMTITRSNALQLADNAIMQFGTDGGSRIFYGGGDASAQAMYFVGPETGATDRAVFHFGDANITTATDFAVDWPDRPHVIVWDDGATDYFDLSHNSSGAVLNTNDGPFLFANAGTVEAQISVTAGDETTFNANQLDIDFRIRSDSNATMFIVDAGLDSIGLGGVATSSGRIEFVTTSRHNDAVTAYFGTNEDFGFYYDETTTDSLLLTEGTVPALAFKGSAIASFAAAANTAGNDIFIISQTGGASTGIGRAGGSLTIGSGDGSAAAGASGLAGGSGGSFTFTAGNGAAGDGAGAGGSGGSFTYNLGVPSDTGGSSGSVGSFTLSQSYAGTSGVSMNLYHASATAADGDAAVTINLQGNNSTPSARSYARIIAEVQDPTATSEEGILRLYVNQNNSITEYLRLDGTDNITSVTLSRMLQGAKGADIASGANISVDKAGNYYDITGTADIDTISATGIQAGTLIVLQFDGTAATNGVRHNQAGTGASILLAGGANFAYAPDDTLMLIYDGATWRQVARTVI